MMFAGSLDALPAGGQLCDGTNGTPNLTDRLIVAAGSTAPAGTEGGAATHSHAAQAHTHSVDIPLTSTTAPHDASPYPGAVGFPWSGSFHAHSVDPSPTGSSATAVTLDAGSTPPPFVALAFVCGV